MYSSLVSENWKETNSRRFYEQTHSELSSSIMKLPNILVTGTPGAGKTFFAKAIAENYGLQFLEISRIVQENHFTDGFDANLDCPILDEDKVCHSTRG